MPASDGFHERDKQAQSEAKHAILERYLYSFTGKLSEAGYVGGYETFVSRVDTNGHPDQPEWLSQVNANVLKVKLAMAIIGISSIHLLKTFIGVSDIGAPAGGTIGGERYTSEGVMWQVIIHCVFIFSALALSLIDRMMLHKPSMRDRISPAEAD